MSLLDHDYRRWLATEVHTGLGEMLRKAGVLAEPLNAYDARAAAEIVLRAVQDDLKRLDSPVGPQVARSLMRERLWALSALIRSERDIPFTAGHKRAKEILLDVTEGAPLTICMGDRYRVRNVQREGVQTTAGYLPFSVDGCRTIIEEDTRTSGEMWKGLCERCRNKSRCDQGRKLRRRVDVIGRGATVYASTFHISDERGNHVDSIDFDTYCEVSDRLTS